MSVIKKNKIHNPQIITEYVPGLITSNDIGRLWVDKINKTLSIALESKTDGTPEMRNILDTTDLEFFDAVYYRGMSEEFTTLELQVPGDLHYDSGYDFFTDSVFLENTTQEYDDFYSYYYKEVTDSSAPGYIRTIATDSGIRNIRLAVGSDTYSFNSTTYNLVNYTKLILSQDVKDIIDITFDNKDTLESGFTLLDDKRTILIFADPEGFFIGKTVKVKYLL